MAPILSVLAICFLICSTEAIAEEKFITIHDYMTLKRPRPDDPYVAYVVLLRCTIVFKAMQEIAGNNNENGAAKAAENTAYKFTEKMAVFQNKANVSDATFAEDAKMYYDIYAERLKRNQALTGHYFTEPTYASDVATCKGLL